MFNTFLETVAIDLKHHKGKILLHIVHYLLYQTFSISSQPK